jgi:hypothetical protein
MAAKLGKIEKPEVTTFKGKRKLFVVSLLLSWAESPIEYNEKLKKYWIQVGEQISGLENRMGRVTQLFHEMVTEEGENGLKVLERISPHSFRLIKEKQTLGATFKLIEDTELVNESTDWERILLLGFLSNNVAQTVSDKYMQATRLRYDYIARKIEENLNQDESGILFIREGHMIQFPTDIEVFSVTPPAFDEIKRWMRDQQSIKTKKIDNNDAKANKSKPEAKKDGKKRRKSKSLN